MDTKTNTQDAPAAAPVAANPAKAVETLYHVGLRDDAPMEIVDIPTLPHYKAVSVPKYTRQLEKDERSPGVFVLGGKLRGRNEALLPIELEHFMKYVRSHSFFIDRTQTIADVDVHGNATNRQVKSGFVVPSDGGKPGDVVRSPRDVVNKMEPLAKYIWIIPATDRSHYAGDPPTIAEMDEKGGE